MNLTDEQLERLIRIRASRMKAARADGRNLPAPALAARPAPAGRLSRFPGPGVLLSALVGAAAALLVVFFIPRPHGEPGVARAPMLTSPDESLRFLAETQLGKAGWRRAGLVVGVSDYPSEFSSFNLRDLPLVPAGVSGARRDLERYSLAAGGNVLTLQDGAATESGARAAARWLAQFDQPGDLILLHVIAHGYSVEPKGLHLVLSDSLKPGREGLTGLPAEDLLRPLAALASTSVLVVDACQAGAVTNMPLGERQCLVASTGPSEQAYDSAFTEAWHKGTQGLADANRDGLVTLREVFDWVAAEVAPGQTPVLREGRTGLAARIVLGVHAQELVARIPPGGKPLPAPGLLKFVPDGPCLLSLDGEPLGQVLDAVDVFVGARPSTLRAVRVSDRENAWQDSAPVTVPPGGTVQRAAVFQPVPAARQESVLLILGNGAAAGRFPRMEAFGNPPVSARVSEEGVLTVESRGAAGGPCGVVLLSENTVEGVDAAYATGALSGETLRLDISARAVGGQVGVVFTCGGRSHESLQPRVEKSTRLDEDWQLVTLAVPAARADRLVSGFGVQFGATEPADAKKIQIRSVTLRR